MTNNGNRENGFGNIILLVVILVALWLFRGGIMDFVSGNDNVVDVVKSQVIQQGTITVNTPSLQDMTVEYTTPIPQIDNSEKEKKARALAVALENLNTGFQENMKNCMATRMAGFPNENNACDQVASVYATAQAQLYNLSQQD